MGERDTESGRGRVWRGTGSGRGRVPHTEWERESGRESLGERERDTHSLPHTERVGEGEGQRLGQGEWRE